MVEEGRKMDVNGSETPGADPSHSGLKLKISLRDRQHLRKRRRSTSPDVSSDSPKEQERTTVLVSPSSKKAHKQRNGSTEDTNNGQQVTNPTEGKQSRDAEILLVSMNGTTAYDGEESSSSQDKISSRNEAFKAKANESIKVEAAAGLIKRLSRQELERLFLEQMCYALRERGVTGVLERQLESTEEQLDRYRSKTEQLNKQVNDLTAVIRRYVNQAKGGKEGLIPPAKITRSVGLQVSTSPPPAQPPTSLQNSTAPNATPSAGSASAPSPVKKPLFSPSQPNRPTVKPSVIVTPATSNPPQPLPQQPVNNSENPSSGSRVSLPPSFTMQSPDIASYVPQQAIPRYRTSTKRSVDSPPVSSPLANSPHAASPHPETSDAQPSSPADGSLKIRLQTKAGSVLRLEGISKLATSAPPLRQISPAPPNQQQGVLVATPAVPASTPIATPVQSIHSSDPTRTRVVNTAVKNGNAVPSTAATVPPKTTVIAGPNPARTPQMTTVNKVTLPGMPPKLIDLTDDVQEAGSNRLATGPPRPNVAPNKAPTPSAQTAAGPNYHVITKVVVPTVNAVKPSSSPLPATSGQKAIAKPAAGAKAPTSVNGMQRVPAVPPPAQVASAHRPLNPASLPATPLGPVNPAWKPLPPRPTLKISRVANGIVLSWTLQAAPGGHADIASYQLFAYQENSTRTSPSPWKKVGDVKALPLPMACTLTQFLEGHRYHFAVRAMDVHGRLGPYSEPNNILLS